jgi:hypothetical protein
MADERGSIWLSRSKRIVTYLNSELVNEHFVVWEHQMKLDRIENMVGGWFIGNFEPSIYKTDAFEVCLKRHAKGESWPTHFHKQATEINCLIRGEMTISDVHLTSGDLFIIEKNEIAQPVFLTDCELIVVKVPSILGDKYSQVF